MLCQFVFKNFKSFKDEAILDMQATNIKEHEKSVIIDKRDNEKFLPVAVIYGPNGGGKSSVLEAFVYLAKKVIMPILALKEMSNDEVDDYGGNSLEERKKKEFGAILQGGNQKRYRFDSNSINGPMTFDISFRTGNYEYKYQLSLVNDNVFEENLFYKNLIYDEYFVAFERDTEGVYLMDELKGVDITSIKSSIPLISYISLTKDFEIVDNVIKWFINSVVLNYDNPFIDRRIIINKNKKNEKQFLKMLNEMDIDIVDLRAVTDSEGNIVDIITKHRISNDKEYELSLDEESSGTRKLFSLLPYILKCLKNGALVVADEMDAKLHPKLLRYIIELFTNPQINKYGAQLLFTSHDLTNMKNKVFRRDEIWFAALNKYSESKLYSLVEFKKNNGDKVRKDESYDKQYIEGRYGADPYLKTIIDWGRIK